tara:strand:- start:1058 stop:1666 length:609 start_codon:yes stop_codon:yes gene_type:complete
MADPEKLNPDQAIEVWKRAIETQMHFNEMSTKSRQLGLTFVVAALGLAVVLLGEGKDVAFSIPICAHQLSIHVSVLIVLVSATALFAVKTLDLGVYHRMLVGAVTFGEEFESTNLVKLMKTPHGMTQFISLYSRYEDAGKQADGSYAGTIKKTAREKLNQFYNVCITLLVSISIALLIFTQFDAFSKTENQPKISTSESDKS